MSNKKDVAVKISGGKKIREAREKVKSDTLYNLTNAVERLKSASYVKFDPTLEIVMKLGIDPRHSDQMVRGVVNLPAGTGKTVRVAVICKEEREEEAKSAGADLVGSTNIIDEIKAGKSNFDVCIATPDMMAAIGSVARILGPKGLMPNPKLGTVTLDIKNAIKNAKSGQVEYRAEKAGIIHAGLGKLSFSGQDLLKNLNAFIEAVIKAKPAGLKGSYLKAMYLSSTMGASVQIDLTSIA
ncbi:50S ribosomal protein L1 [Rickettsia amblyommatis]|uniref:Large ribosomal subunit protein uL1 n=2 Tax=Rickettsia amblyommatis TaxID=33989 RepID=H8K471_RICAG|nr:50S ribosomal protein L1 [Rickettsia amblyommatis]AFC69315.1 50S ribosomal protein L1 [Rickettsia amblyommatis str. GAT-30V]ALA61450.1 50S ribosomal protein L1 [Rickettsia amblyommatis]ARD87557.1 50S ribosomal protein L1 [Rickettsia amblyommatis]KJV61562.1 ribosomal protein L1 [Rickettsia amblyommatis str. Ac/Pa]KJV97608.1 ribosomal protein L1 [Rickettsia amblyommatis str. Darkwater]